MKKFKEYITEITLSDVNKVAKKYEMKLNRGKGYYYFTGTNPSANIRLNKLYRGTTTLLEQIQARILD